MKTIIAAFQEVVEQYPNNTALAFLIQDHYKKITYKQLDNYRLQLAYYWQKNAWKKGQKVAIMLENSPEWAISDLAAATLGIVTVPIHTTYNHIFLKNVILHSETDYLVIHKKFYDKHKDTIHKLPLKKIIIVGFIEEQNNKAKIEAWPLSYKETQVSKVRADIHANDLHTIIYTSGTTGDPKGVMLSHRNLIINAQSAKRTVIINPEDRFFSFLPLSHAFERIAGYYVAMLSGSSIYFSQSKETLIEDIKKAKPTIINSVPRIFEKIYGKIFDKIDSSNPRKKKIFFKGLQLSVLRRKDELTFTQTFLWFLLNILVFRKLRSILGGHLRLAVSGGASLDLKVIKFFENLGVQIIEGYGMTETSPIISVNPISDCRAGTVGQALDCNQIKILDNKEILIKGDNVMLGYYNNDALTKETIDNNGWLHSGDLGFVDKEGFLTIIGRAKDMIVLSTGKNIFPEGIENVLNESRYISQSMIYGDKSKHISAFIVPNFEQLKLWCEKHNIKLNLTDERIIDFYKLKIDHRLKNFAKVEQINNFKLISEEFSQENGLLTPTLKLKREKVLNKFL